jgi:hypothetical protein
MRDSPPSVRRAVLTAVGGALFTAVLWTIITGDVGRGASYGAIVLGVLLATAALERRRREQPPAEATSRPQRRETPAAEVTPGPRRRQKRRRR